MEEVRVSKAKGRLGKLQLEPLVRCKMVHEVSAQGVYVRHFFGKNAPVIEVNGSVVKLIASNHNWNLAPLDGPLAGNIPSYPELVRGIEGNGRIIDRFCKALPPEKGNIGADIPFKYKIKVIRLDITGVLAGFKCGSIAQTGFTI